MSPYSNNLSHFSAQAKKLRQVKEIIRISRSWFYIKKNKMQDNSHFFASNENEKTGKVICEIEALRQDLRRALFILDEGRELLDIRFVLR